jgi:hypothetical protein
VALISLMLPESTDVKHVSQSCSVTIQAQEEAVAHEEAVSEKLLSASFGFLFYLFEYF